MSYNCLGVLNTVHGLIPANQYINELIWKNNYQLPILSEFTCKSIFENCIVQAFANSNVAKSFDYGQGDYPLWGHATMIMNK